MWNYLAYRGGSPYFEDGQTLSRNTHRLTSTALAVMARDEPERTEMVSIAYASTIACYDERTSDVLP